MRGCVAALMYVYAGAGLVLGMLVSLGYAPIVLPLLLGVACVVAGTALSARPGVLPSLLLVVGGITTAGMFGVAAALWEYDEPGQLAVGFAFGALLFGWPPLLVAAGRLALPSGGSGADR